ncbi:MAG TPA: N-acetyl-alpha-D-glucosaminyl L-malate synthase BshA [Vicinamibacteria bacterium]|nr:N-acetyl-alpha-D-glucosaminyl L-malate synthase BshA [Vicinamibacteria bacterium]
MKIAIVCYPTHGGSGVVASELALGLARRGHRVHIVSYAVPFRLRGFHPNLHMHEVEVSTYPLFKYPPYTLALATKLAQVAVDEEIDVIHAHYAVPHAVSALLARQILGGQAPKIVTTLHGTDITLVGADESFHRVIKFAIEVSDAVTTVSQYLRARTIEEFSIERAIEVVYNFVDTSRPLRQSAAREHWAPRGEKILVHASNFRPVKRAGDVVAIFDLVRRRMPAKLLLVGEGPDRIMVRDLVKDSGRQEDVHFLGEQDDLESILASSDLLLLPSEEESFGLVALEAAAAGVPVVGSRVGGLPEVVVHGETGYLLPVGETGPMAEAAIAVLSTPSEWKRLSEAGRKRAAERFDAAFIVPQYEHVYEKLVSASPPR